MEKKLKMLTLLTFITLFTITTVYGISRDYQVTHKGTIQALGLKVYASDRVTILSELDWGDIFCGETYQKFGYLQSKATVNATVKYNVINLPVYLTFKLYYQKGYFDSNSVWTNTTNWITMNINEDYLIKPDEWWKLKFELTVSNDATPGNFNFEIILSINAPYT